MVNERRQTLTDYLDSRVVKVVERNFSRVATLLPKISVSSLHPASFHPQRPSLTPSLNCYVVDLLPIDVYPVR